MSYWLDKIDALVAQQKKMEAPLTLEGIPGITLAEFARRNLAVEIYSELLRSTFWLCSNDQMFSQIEEDAPGSVCYTVDEMRELIDLDPSPVDLQKIQDAKITFTSSILKNR